MEPWKGWGNEGGDGRVNRMRGIVMLLAAAVAGWKGWQIRHGQQAVIAYGLALLALALGAWHLLRRESLPRGGDRPGANSHDPNGGNQL